MGAPVASKHVSANCHLAIAAKGGKSFHGIAEECRAIVAGIKGLSRK